MLAGLSPDHYTSVDKLIDHPVVGPLTFSIEGLTSPHDPEQRLVVYTAEPNSPTARTMPILASWGLDQLAGEQR